MDGGSTIGQDEIQQAIAASLGPKTRRAGEQARMVGPDAMGRERPLPAPLPPTSLAPALDDITKRIKLSQRLHRQLAQQQRSAIIARRRADDEAAARARGGLSEPTKERGKRGSLVAVSAIASDEGVPAAAGAKMRRVQSPVDRYHARGHISSRQAQAADNLRNDYEFGICGAHDTSKASGSGGARGYADLQLDAATRHKKALAAMGPRLSAIVIPVVIGDAGGGEITVGMLARSRGEKSEQQLMGVFKIGLDVLADHYRLA